MTILTSWLTPPFDGYHFCRSCDLAPGRSPPRLTLVNAALSRGLEVALDIR